MITQIYTPLLYYPGIQGIVQAYQNCISQIRLWGPTNTAPIIYHVARFAAAAQQEEQTKGAHVRAVKVLKIRLPGKLL